MWYLKTVTVASMMMNLSNCDHKDAVKELKKSSNQIQKSIYEQLRKQVEDPDTPTDTNVKLNKAQLLQKSKVFGSNECLTCPKYESGDPNL